MPIGIIACISCLVIGIIIGMMINSSRINAVIKEAKKQMDESQRIIEQNRRILNQ